MHTQTQKEAFLEADRAYALQSSAERERRFQLLDAPHIAPLTTYIRQIQGQHNVPFFDPCDGGVNAKILFLLEAPGPKAVASGFVSRNNPDQTAKRLCDLMQAAQIPRTDTVLWNIVPWYVGDSDGMRIRPVNKTNFDAALPHLAGLLVLLPHLEQIVLLGKKAQQAEAHLQTLTELPIHSTYHPSPRVFNTMPAQRQHIENTFHALPPRARA